MYRMIKYKNPWWVKAERFLNVTVFNLMREGECHSAFQSVEEMTSFAKLLEDDLKAGRAMTSVTKMEYQNVINAINEVVAAS